VAVEHAAIEPSSTWWPVVAGRVALLVGLGRRAHTAVMPALAAG
jgi:hypothetical protein